jgi:HJR/Mrr/RecB family endonuclease
MINVFPATRVALLSVALLSSACGGGSGGSGGHSSPAVPLPGSLQFQAGSFVVDENAGTASVTITRTGGSDGAVSVSVASSNGSATATQDYSAVSTTVNFAAGNAVKTISVPITDDATAELDESLTLTLSAPTGGAALGATTAATLTIRDDDPPPAPAAAIGATVKQLVFTWQSVPGATHYRVMRKLGGAAGFTQVGPDHPPTGSATLSATLDIVLYRHDWASTQYQVDACNGQACAASTEMDALSSMLQSIGYFKASNTQDGDTFGTAIALSADGNTLAVGAPSEDSSATGVNGNQLDENARDAGAVYVFARNGTQWSPPTYVKASNTETRDAFGKSIALSADGNTLAVGAIGEDSLPPAMGGNAADNGAPQAGAVYVFTRSAGQWLQEAFVKASNAEENDEFGFSLALSDDGNTLAVGARGEDSKATGIGGDEIDNNQNGSGAAYLFSRTAGQWAQQAYVKASNTETGDSFGWALALSGDGNTLAVAAPNEASSATGVDGVQSDNSATAAGAVYVYAHAAGQWSPTAYVKASNTQKSDQFGFALALSADGATLAVSSVAEASHATGVDGDQNDNSSPFAGAVYVYAHSAGQWSQTYVKASNTEPNDQFGHSVALSADGNTLAVGARGERSSALGIGGDQSDNGAAVSGAAYVFSRAAGQWSQQAYIKASNTEAFDDYGRTLALSADGNTLAVGAIFEASKATGVGGDQTDNSADLAGAVYLY